MPKASKINTPNVFLEEKSLVPPTVIGVETGIPAFVGYTEKNRTAAGVTLQNKPTRISTLLEYTALFGGAQPENRSIKIQIQDLVQKILPDKSQEVLKSREIQALLDPTKRSKFNLYYAIQWYFANGGGPCYIVSVGITPAIGTGNPLKTRLLAGLYALEKEDEPTMLVVPEAIQSGFASEIYAAALAQAGKLGDRMVILDVQQSADLNDDMDTFRAAITSAKLRYGAAYYPHLETSLKLRYYEAAVTIEHQKKDLTGASENGAFHKKTLNTITDQSLHNSIKTKINQIPLQLPPSPGIAGVWARVDRERGVWKAPANESLDMVIRPCISIDDNDQMTMNVDANGGKSVNAIRTFTGRGTVIWGARTLEGNDNEWRYIPVRRLFNFVEESVKKATLGFVFEPNDANTWTKVRAMVEDFLHLQWIAGALQGAGPNQAYFVRVGLGQTMTDLDVLEGRLIVQIGMAAIRPAEFIILGITVNMA